MTEENPPNVGGADNDRQRSRGSMRHQDAASTTPREPSLAEQRARAKAEAEERERRRAEMQARIEEEERAEKRRKLLIGGGVGLGLVGLIAGYYLVSTPDEVTAVCTDADGTVVEDDDYCDEDYVESHGGYTSGGFMFLPLPGGGYRQYRYNYGGSGTPGTQVSGGSYSKPANAKISTRSGTTIQRGGFGVSGRSGSSGT